MDPLVVQTCSLVPCFLPVPLAVPTWLKKPQDSQLEEGKPGYLHCLTQATPKPTVVWYRNQMLISEVRMLLAAGGGGHGAHPAGTPVPGAARGEMLVGPRAVSPHGHVTCASGLTVRSVQERDVAYQQCGGVRWHVVPLREQHPSWQHRGPSSCPSVG